MSEKTKAVAVGNRQGLALPIELEEGAPPIYYRGALEILSGMVIALLLWANIAQVREASVAPGAIAPSQSIRHVAHLEGGIVDTVNVEQGATVSPGEELLRLRPESGDGRYAQNAARRADLELRIERLTAQVEGRAPDFSPFASDWPSFVSEQTSIYETAQAQQGSIVRASEASVASTNAEKQGAAAAVREKRQQLDLAKQQLDIQEELIGGGFTSKQSHLEAKSAFLAADASLNEALTRLERANRSYNSASAELQRVEAEYRSRVSEERAASVAELVELQEAIVISEDRDNRLVVRAPIAGVVNNLTVMGNGDVVRPGQVVADIVPIGAEMIADVRVSPKDIGYVSIGQDAEVTITTFDPKKYGFLKGKISNIAPDSIIDEQTGEHYYQVQIGFSNADDANQALISKLTPGMETSVKIITNSRSMMIYLLKPIARSLENAFSEK